MPTKTASSQPSALGTPMADAMLLGAAAALGLAMLVNRGRMAWPPAHLLSNAYTIAGCLALVGPLVLLRRKAAGSGLGDLLWMTAGLLLWLFDLTALLHGGLRSVSWATPLSYQPMGLTMLAVLLAGWRLRSGARDWSWTNVTGWILGLFWIGAALITFWPGRQFWAPLR